MLRRTYTIVTRLKHFGFMLLVAYVLIFGATYNGILDARFRLYDVLLLVAALGFWLWKRRRWRWYGTALDGAILVWIAAFVISLIGNSDAWRRIAIGLWFMGLYIGLWFVLQDAFANDVAHRGGLRRAWLVDALLVSTVPIVFVGYAQVYSYTLRGEGLPRPVGTLGNPNTLAALLVMILPFSVGRLIAARTPLSRILYAVYTLAMIVMLGFTFSRGGWIAGVAGLALWALLSLPLRRWWLAIRRPLRVVLVVVALLGLIFLAYDIFLSLGIGGRGLDLRTFLYETALRLFAEKPLTGTGLFNFGAGLARLNSIPPTEPHSHAHNIILQVAAELGIVGLLALALTAWAAWRALLAARRTSDPIARMGVAAFAAFVVHQMLDLPAMMPAIALVALAVLALALPVPTEPKRRRWQPGLLALGALALAVTGLWSAFTYGEYVSALSDAVNTGDYRGGAARLQKLADSDPSLSLYAQQRGMLLGLQAASGDRDAAQAAADSFAHYAALEPYYVSGWVNLAALDAQMGKDDDAVAAMHQAVALASESAPLLYSAGLLFEAKGVPDSARAAYTAAVAIDPDMPLLPGWNDSPLRQDAGEGATPSLIAQTVLLLEKGDVAGAQAVWDTNPGRGNLYASNEVVMLMLALAQGDDAQAQLEQYEARRDAISPADHAWQHLGAALLDAASFDAEIAAARAALQIGPTNADWDYGANIAYIQYLHLAIPRLFLPQVGYPQGDSLLNHLLGDATALDQLRAATNP